MRGKGRKGMKSDYRHRPAGSVARKKISRSFEREISAKQKKSFVIDVQQPGIADKHFFTPIER